MNKKVIEMWGIVCDDDPFMAPELRVSKLHGFIDEGEGKLITTSAIVGKRGDAIVTKSGSEYFLGDVAEQYEKLYPNARGRLFGSLEEV